MELKIKITIVLVAKTRGDVLIECMKQSGIVVGIASNRAGHTATNSLVKSAGGCKLSKVLSLSHCASN